MKEVTLRRPRKRKPTITPRFGTSSIALEISLVRMAIEVQKELEKKLNQG